jgi:hypothetical protein
VSNTELSVFVDARIPLRSRGKVDLVAIAGGGIGFTESSPDGDDNNTRTIVLDAHWGLGLEYWWTSHVAISVSATNPAFTRTSETQEMAGDDSSDTSYLFGAIWDPTIGAMVHLFL